MRILLGCSHVSTTVQLHYLDFNKMYGGKARWELHKDAAYCYKQILEIASWKQQLYSHLTPIQVRWIRHAGEARMNP